MMTRSGGGDGDDSHQHVTHSKSRPPPLRHDLQPAVTKPRPSKSSLHNLFLCPIRNVDLARTQELRPPRSGWCTAHARHKSTPHAAQRERKRGSEEAREGRGYGMERAGREEKRRKEGRE
eukprot:1402014-Rhodomonas_salina.1